MSDFPTRSDIVGIELSGATTYAKRLSKKLSYMNTFFHKKPYLDITNIEASKEGSCDFVISSEVFEHIAPPVERAFNNTMRLLKPGGLLILTVPYIQEGSTVEYFLQLHDYEIKTEMGKKVLINKSVDGEVSRFNDLVFHGGKGETLEMRIFSESGILRELEKAGFVDIKIHHEAFERFGIRWPDSWSLPITARKSGVLA